MFLLGVVMLFLCITISAFSSSQMATIRQVRSRVGTRRLCAFVPETLQDKNVYFIATIKGTRPPRPFREVWDSLRQALTRNSDNADGLPSAEEALIVLKKPLTAEYSTETEFDVALFQALRDCLKAFELRQQQDDDKTILLNLAETQEYAVGMARETLPDPLVMDEMLTEYFVPSRDTSITEMGDVDTILLGHAVCLFQKRKSKWRATDCFSNVELKMSDSSCADFDLDDCDSKIRKPELGGRHGAFGQAIICNLGCVLIHRAKRGVLGDHIPLAMIAGKKKKESLEPISLKKPPLLRWVSGRLDVPEACGDAFFYFVDDFGQFANDDNDGSVEEALSVYVETVLFGLNAAMDVLKKLATGKMPLAVPASGQSLMFGQVPLNLQLCASPIQGAVTSDDPSKTHNWTVSHGELFKGKLNVGEVIRNAGVRLVDFRSGRSKRFGALDVLVKVSSTTVHNLFTKPGIAYVALRIISLGGKRLSKEVGSVLYAAVQTNAGMVTIMADMTKQGYGPLKPIESHNDLAVLWGGFHDLVERVLLPMAEIGIVHADLRPGYDITYNILCKLQIGRDGVKKATMKLIDYESIVHLLDWNVHGIDGRYIKPEPGWDATTYLWWQCVAIAFAWKEALNGNSLLMGNALADMKEALLDDLSGPSAKVSWLDKYRDRAKSKINATAVKMTVRELAEEFFVNSQPVLVQRFSFTK